MTNFKVTNYADREQLDAAAAAAIAEEIATPSATPAMLMLSGGSTPVPAYRLVGGGGVRAGGGAFVMYSDERLVPPDSVHSNYGCTRDLLTAAGLPENRVVRVHTDLDGAAAATRYHNDITQIITRDVACRVAILGIGADGHTASLFSIEHARQAGTYAIFAGKQAGFDRVSVTSALLKRFERLIFLVSGESKKAIATTLLREPQSIPAGCAVAGHGCVEVWTDFVLA